MGRLPGFVLILPRIFQRAIEQPEDIEEYESRGAQCKEDNEPKDHSENNQQDVHTDHITTRAFLAFSCPNRVPIIERSLQEIRLPCRFFDLNLLHPPYDLRIRSKLHSELRV